MKDDAVYLKHILDATAKIESYVAVGREEFAARSHWQDDVIRQPSSVKRPSACRLISSHYPEVPWRRIAGLRDVLIHDYMGVDIAAVWQITQKDLPPFKEHVQRILQDMGGTY